MTCAADRTERRSGRARSCVGGLRASVRVEEAAEHATEKSGGTSWRRVQLVLMLRSDDVMAEGKKSWCICFQLDLLPTPSRRCTPASRGAQKESFLVNTASRGACRHRYSFYGDYLARLACRTQPLLRENPGLRSLAPTQSANHS